LFLSTHLDTAFRSLRLFGLVDLIVGARLDDIDVRLRDD
jgi:hypothetical protein